jgi:hypothetical protein
VNESLVSRKLRIALNEEGAVCWKMSDRFHAARPDLIACFLGQFIAIETKIHPNKPTLLQAHELNTLVFVDAWCYVVTYHPVKKLLVAEQLLSGDSVVSQDYKEIARWILKLSA